VYSSLPRAHTHTHVVCVCVCVSCVSAAAHIPGVCPSHSPKRFLDKSGPRT
jgi:hypothetical protein